MDKKITRCQGARVSRGGERIACMIRTKNKYCAKHTKGKCARCHDWVVANWYYTADVGRFELLYFCSLKCKEDYLFTDDWRIAKNEM